MKCMKNWQQIRIFWTFNYFVIWCFTANPLWISDFSLLKFDLSFLNYLSMWISIYLIIPSISFSPKNVMKFLPCVLRGIFVGLTLSNRVGFEMDIFGAIFFRGDHCYYSDWYSCHYHYSDYEYDEDFPWEVFAWLGSRDFHRGWTRDRGCSHSCPLLLQIHLNKKMIRGF